MICNKSIVLLLCAVGLASASSIGPDLKNLCGRGKVSLKTVADLTALVEQADSNSAGCPPIVIEALEAMKKITDEKKACTMDKAVAVTDFVDKYLKETAYAIPKALANFALAYGSKVSSICTDQMANDFVSVTQARVYDSMDANIYDAFVDFKLFLLEQNPMGALLGAIAKTGEVILPVDMLQVLPEQNAKFIVQIAQSDLHGKFVSLCQKVLQPLYEPMLLPIAHLVRNGFVSRPSLKDKRSKRDVRFWSTALFFCESLKLVEVQVSETPVLKAIESEAGDALSSLSESKLPCADEDDDDDGEEETQDAKQALEAESSLAGPDNKSRPPVIQSAYKAPIEPFVSEAEVDGVIVTSRVKAFDSSKNGAQRLGERISGRSFRVMQALARTSKMRSLIKDSLKLVKLQGGSNAAEFEKNKQSFSEMIEKPELFDSGVGGGSCPGGKCMAERKCKGNKCLVRKEDNEFEHKAGLRSCFGNTIGCIGGPILVVGAIAFTAVRALTFIILVIWALANLIPRALCLCACCLCGQCQKGSCLLTLFNSIDDVVCTLLLWPTGNRESRCTAKFAYGLRIYEYAQLSAF